MARTSLSISRAEGPPPAPARSNEKVPDRVLQTHGESIEDVYLMVSRELSRRSSGGCLVDVGCGSGNLWRHLGNVFDRYVGVDALRFDGFPADAELISADLDFLPIPLPNDYAEMVAAVEVIEHLENPRAFARELARIVKPDGWIFITTPNQRSLLSLGTLLLKGQFNAFQERPGLYPAHLTALLEIDLLRIARELGLRDIAIVYSDRGRAPLSARLWPRVLGGRLFSDNLMLTARKPAGKSGGISE